MTDSRLCVVEQSVSLAASTEDAAIRDTLQSPDAIAARGFSADEWSTIEAMPSKAFVGTAAELGAQLRALANELELDELVVNTWAHDPAARRTSYALLAQEFGLTP